MSRNLKMCRCRKFCIYAILSCVNAGQLAAAARLVMNYGMLYAKDYDGIKSLNKTLCTKLEELNDHEQKKLNLLVG